MPDKTPWGPEHPKYPNCPVAPRTDCTVWFRDGMACRLLAPESLPMWNHERCGGHSDYDITFFTDHSAPDQARELLAKAREAIHLHPHSMGCGLHDPGDYRGICTCGANVKNEPLKALTARIDAYLKGAS